MIALGNTIAGAALNAATRKLAEIAFPQMTPQSTVQTGGATEIMMELEYVGWYETLGWVLLSRTSTTNTITTTQVGTLIGSGAPGIGATNLFLSTSTEHITSSGISDTEFIADDTSYRQKIEALLSQGDSLGQRLVWGVYADRTFYVDIWAGIDPDVVDYQRSAAESVVRDKVGGVVPWWEVKVNKMYQRNELLEVNPTTGQSDSAGRFPIERTTCAIAQGQVTLTLEGPSITSADTIIARLSN